ncbi:MULTISPECIES: hypothetical protein [Pseudomonas]|uniref:Uncharacterized protein n=1 Tax=Pseudomonas izuensis TaxID=2684212 RepID=A0ABM7RYR5_9PSED|nr:MULTISPECIES: hypothetical protein [Pseudomonas]RKS20015.1 hypothetical protein BJ917_3903 [Pseudomonas sp. WPR_5_2]BCX71064.1 hypothetical protein LAB08_R57520 [Pseudomonas izuensis]
MRYLKVIAQDRSGGGVADTLQFQFFEGEQLLREATDDEIRRLRTFGSTYLKCRWFNAGEGEERHLRMFSLNPSGDGTPESVRLHFHEGPIIAYKAAVHDLDNDGTFEIVLVSDIDNDGHANRTDRTRLNTLVREFLKLEW